MESPFLIKPSILQLYNIAAQQDYVQKNPEIVKQFLRAVIKAETFVDQHKDEAQSIISTATKTDIDLVREVWNIFFLPRHS